MFIHDISRNGKVAWKAGDKGTIKTVRNVMNKNNILVTRRSYEEKGGLFDQQIMKKGKGQVPVKTSDERLHDIINMVAIIRRLVHILCLSNLQMQKEMNKGR